MDILFVSQSTVQVILVFSGHKLVDFCESKVSILPSCVKPVRYTTYDRNMSMHVIEKYNPG